MTSPGSPDFNYQQKLQATGHHPKRALGRYQRRLMHSGSIDPNVGGRLQIKLGFEASTLQLIVTVVCAADFTYRPNGAPRNPYAKVSELFIFFLLTFALIFNFVLDFLASLSFRQIETTNENIS